MVSRLITAIRRHLPIPDESERQRWRRQMTASRDAAASEATRLRIQRAEMQGPVEDAIFPARQKEQPR